jgi:hypothetical protein
MLLTCRATVLSLITRVSAISRFVCRRSGVPDATGSELDIDIRGQHPGTLDCSPVSVTTVPPKAAIKTPGGGILRITTEMAGGQELAELSHELVR